MTIEPGSIVEMTEAEIYSMNKKIANDYELLIKAAPDLLKACQEAIKDYKQADCCNDMIFEWTTMMEKAITKATGEQYEN